MAVHGSIGEFSVGSETWVSYIERLQQYFVANNIKGEDRERAVLLSVCGASTYQLIRSVVSPEKPTEKIFELLVTLMSIIFPSRQSQCSDSRLTPDSVSKKNQSLPLLPICEL